jgi:mannose-6-phosphate isomerase-like protein (cupin superfamily)
MLTLTATREVNMGELITKVLGSKPDAIAPDGSEVRLLQEMTRGGMAHFALGPHHVSKAVAHKTIEEIWYFIRGRGRIWRRLGSSEEVVDVFPGVSINVPTGTQFQFRNEGDETLEAIGVTMPPWPGADEAFQVKGIWEPTVCTRSVTLLGGAIAWSYVAGAGLRETVDGRVHRFDILGVRRGHRANLW